MPEEALTEDDLEGLCFVATDPAGPFGTTVVLGSPPADRAPDGAVIVSLRRPEGPGGDLVGYVQLVVVHPSRRRRGHARRLIAAAERWAAERGASTVHAGGAAPLYLFTGVDSRWIEAVCLFESLGYERTAVELDLFCPTRGQNRRPAPAGVAVERVTSDADLEDLVAWSERCWPWWTAELARAGSAGTAVVARDEHGVVLGAAAHSVGRLGVIGPVAVEPGLSKGGIGTALMGAVLADLSAAGLQRAEIAWVTTVRFYVRSCGAKVGRASQVLRRTLDADEVRIASLP